MSNEKTSFPAIRERRVIPEGTVAASIGVDSQSDGFVWLLACWGQKNGMLATAD
jgi:hypothetical protein